jgi:hypothetical protein
MSVKRNRTNRSTGHRYAETVAKPSRDVLVKEDMDSLVGSWTKKQKSPQRSDKNLESRESNSFPFGNLCDFYTTKSAEVATEEKYRHERKALAKHMYCYYNIYRSCGSRKTSFVP